MVLYPPQLTIFSCVCWPNFGWNLDLSWRGVGSAGGYFWPKEPKDVLPYPCVTHTKRFRTCIWFVWSPAPALPSAHHFQPFLLSKLWLNLGLPWRVSVVLMVDIGDPRSSKMCCHILTVSSCFYIGIKYNHSSHQHEFFPMLNTMKDRGCLISFTQKSVICITNVPMTNFCIH